MRQLSKYLLIATCFTGVSLFAQNALSTDRENRSLKEVPKQVRHCLKSASGSNLANVVEVLKTLSTNDLNEALTELSPVNFGNIEWINERNNSYVVELLSQHLFELCCSTRNCWNCDCCGCRCNKSFWINAFVNFENNRQLDNLNRFYATAGGILAGFDWCWPTGLYFGGSFGYTFTELKWHEKGNGHLNSFYGAFYGSWNDWDWLSVDVSAIGGAMEHGLKRKIKFASISRRAKSDPWGEFFTGHLGLKGDVDWCCTKFEPFGLVDYHYFHRNHIKEHGAGSLNLNVEAKTQHFLRGEAGLILYWNFGNECYCVGPYLGLSWVGEFPLNTSKQRATFEGQSCVMFVKSYDSSVQLGSPQAGVKWTLTDGYSFILGYKGLFNSETAINELEGRVEWIF